jgi:hypothetical protein
MTTNSAVADAGCSLQAAMFPPEYQSGDRQSKAFLRQRAAFAYVSVPLQLPPDQGVTGLSQR